jgi:competence protein ComEC
MLSGISGFISGVIVLYFFTELLNTSLFSIKTAGLLVVALTVLKAAISFRIRSCRLSIDPYFVHAVYVFCMGLILGLCYAQQSCLQLKEAILPAHYDNQTLIVEGFLCGLPKRSEFSYSAEFCVTELTSQAGHVIPGKGYKASLRWPLEFELPQRPSVLKITGQHPRATVNFAGFPYEANLFYKAIILSGKVQQISHVAQVPVLSSLEMLRYYYHQARLTLSQLSDHLLEGTQHEGMLRALLLGDRSRLSITDNKLLGQTGTQHLIAISGLHVGIVMLGLYMLFPKSPGSLLLLAVIGGIYVLLVGFGPSAQRAWVMCLLGLIYAAGYLKQGKWHIYLWALALVLLIDPVAPLNLGFWFSFICVAILILIAQGLNLAEHPWRAFICLQFLVMLGLVPVASELGLPNGPANVLANLIAVPWISLLILPLTLIGFVLASMAYAWSGSVFNLLKSLFDVLDNLLEMLMAFLESLSIFRYDWLFEAGFLVHFCYLIIFVSLLLMVRFTSARLTMITALLLVVLFPSRLQHSLHELLVFDSGQGLAIAMSFDGQTWLYDTGPAYGRLSTVDQVILPYLRSRQLLSKTTGLIVSHGDADHAGDLPSLLDVLVTPVLVSGEPGRVSRRQYFKKCHAGMRWESKNASLEVLYPLKADVISGADQYNPKDALNSNNHSCVVRFELSGTSFLLMGDVEGEAELELVRHYRDKLKADVLIAGHHGAPKGSSYALLKHVLPEYVVFSAGYSNPFGHPAKSVTARVRQISAQALNTALSGALRFEVNPLTRQLIVTTAREERAAFWLRQMVN